ncbi:substrate-binding periplasmic protein [Spartinivicinus poritis]|uniref:Transporter substrate-binding domain-containing protein n=1 Tax=Spartinivicinus poritis TaxID=2994640 RepID=A0ABT5UH32_9GAMM|nr:transporter substrate-binding domain-containing protein [Spartinivicinus sp. A2-2]MDE1465700.1 transporter substrate-binding domain-containing protein [Spartinivicinus sp. A2-2]
MGWLVGLDISLLKAVFEKANCRYKIIIVNWKRSLKELEKGSLDVVLTASITSERKQYAYFSSPYREEQMRIFVRKDQSANWPLKQLADIISYNMKLAITLGSYYGEEFEQLYNNNSDFKSFIINVAQPEQGLLMVASKRTDGVLQDMYNLHSQAETLKIRDKLEIHPYIVSSGPVHFMFSKKSVTHQDVYTINKALVDFIKTEDYQTIYKFD